MSSEEWVSGVISVCLWELVIILYCRFDLVELVLNSMIIIRMFGMN